MSIPISSRASMLRESFLQSIFAMAKSKPMKHKGFDQLNLGVGEPDTPPPSEIIEAAVKALQDRQTGYLPATGSLKTRQAIADDCNCDPEEVIVTHGSKHALGAIMAVTLNAGNNVMVASPYYEPFIQAIRFNGAEPLIVETKDNGFRLSFELVRDAYKKAVDKPKAIIICSPNNPAGTIYSCQEIEKISAFCEGVGMQIISDNCYRHFTSFFQPLRLLCKKWIDVYSLSKSYSIPGLRLGYAIMPKEQARLARLYLENNTGCPNSLSESIILTALQTKPIQDFEKQRQILDRWLLSKKLAYATPTGGFYAFPDFSTVIEKIWGVDDSDDLTGYILDHFNLVLTPGKAFGNYPNHVRIAYCVKEGVLSQALSRLEKIF